MTIYGFRSPRRKLEGHIMLKALEAAIEKAKGMTLDQQAIAAELLEHMATSFSAPYEIPEAHRADVLEGLAQAERHEFVSDGEMAAFWKKCGL